jgi:hypothetical protein
MRKSIDRGTTAAHAVISLQQYLSYQSIHSNYAPPPNLPVLNYPVAPGCLVMRMQFVQLAMHGTTWMDTLHCDG